ISPLGNSISADICPSMRSPVIVSSMILTPASVAAQRLRDELCVGVSGEDLFMVQSSRQEMKLEEEYEHSTISYGPNVRLSRYKVYRLGRGGRRVWGI